MEVIDLASSEPEVIEILSSPQTPHKSSVLSSFSPLFEQDVEDIKHLSRKSEHSEKKSPKVKTPKEKHGRVRTPKKKSPSLKSTPQNVSLTQVCTPEPVVIESTPHSLKANFELPVPSSPLVRYTQTNIEVSKTSKAEENEGYLGKRLLEELDSAMAAGVFEPKPKKKMFKSPKKSNGQFSEMQDQILKKPPKTAAPLMTRTKAGNCLLCNVYDPTSKWTPLIQQELQDAGCISAELANTLRFENNVPPGVDFILFARGRFSDAWNDEMQTFVKLSAHEVHEENLKHAFIIINSAQFATMVEMSQEERKKYFADVRALIPESTQAVFFFPEFTQHFKKLLDKWNREMRRRVSVDSNTRLTELPPLDLPPNEETYSTVQTELEVFHNIHAVYPQKKQETAQLLANGAIESAFKRYSAQENQSDVIVSHGTVRSKTSTLDISVESLIKIPGLPPRIAQQLAGEAGSIGKIRDYLGINTAMRQSRVRHFGKGTWNEALLTFLETEDPKEVLQ